MLSKKIFILVFINKNNLEFSCKTAIFEVGDDRKACFRQVGQKEQKKKMCATLTSNTHYKCIILNKTLPTETEPTQFIIL